MEKNILENETLLARWLANEASGQEKKSLERHPDYEAIRSVVEQSNHMYIGGFDTEDQLNKLHQLQKPSSGSSILKYRWPAIAASLVVLIAAYYIFLYHPFKKDIIKTPYAQVKEWVLPDQTKVWLNADTEISFSGKAFNQNRTLNLTGEAFFDVTAGENFEINTPLGSVEVLGTSFNVYSRKEIFEVACKMGSVRVTDFRTNNDYILKPGDLVRMTDSESEVLHDVSLEEVIHWQSGESSFDNQPLQRVLDELSRQFDIRIKTEKVNPETRLTTSFTHDNLENSLKFILTPLNLQYEFKEGVIWIRPDNEVK